MFLRRFALCLLCVTALLVGAKTSRAAEETHAPLLYPLANKKPIPIPNIVLDLSAAPDARIWAGEAVTLMRDWFPLIWTFLATENATPPKTIHLTFKHKAEAPGITSGNDITVDADTVLQNPSDFGLVIHELTHVIQAYPDAGEKAEKPVWLGEGIADYIRYWRYEPERPHPRIDVEKASYRDGYHTTAAFLAWLTWKYDRRIVHDLDGALRVGKYTVSLFEKRTKKPLDTLWTEFLADQKHD